MRIWLDPVRLTNFQLTPVDVPMVFFGGSTGVIYRPFSITIVAAMALSVLVAPIFTPALCTTLLKPGAATAPAMPWPRWSGCRRAAAGYRLRLCGLSNDVCFQVGLLATIGPSAKSAILILGVVPRATSSGAGAGAGSRHAIGTGVIGGMLTVTVLAIFWVPLFHVRVSSWFTERSRARGRGENAQ